MSTEDSTLKPQLFCSESVACFHEEWKRRRRTEEEMISMLALSRSLWLTGGEECGGADYIFGAGRRNSRQGWGIDGEQERRGGAGWRERQEVGRGRCEGWRVERATYSKYGIELNLTVLYCVVLNWVCTLTTGGEYRKIPAWGWGSSQGRSSREFPRPNAGICLYSPTWVKVQTLSDL